MKVEKILVGMSGGVDSSVCALLLLKKGYTVAGLTLKHFDPEAVRLSTEETAMSDNSVEDARNVAEKLGIKHFAEDFSEEFKRRVTDEFAAAYINGRTPNPCLNCNKYLKFGKMLDYAADKGYNKIATGHYARTEFDEESNRFLLKRALNRQKDQSYVLYMLTQRQLSRTLFPLGEFDKEKIREIAEENGLANARKKDSQDICFIRNGEYARFICEKYGYIPKSGNYTDKDGKIIGSHKGIIYYTIGQRKGLGISFNKHLFVLSKNAATNTVMLGDNEDLFSSEVVCGETNFIPFDTITQPINVTAKARYSMQDAPCTVYPLPKDKIKVVFDEPQRAITPGQAVVLYDGEYVIGGGIAESTDAD